MNDNLRPTNAEIAFLNLAYNRFYNIFEEAMTDSFWKKPKRYRFTRIKDGFVVYGELLGYEPIKWVIEHLRNSRPPMEAEIGSELFKFIRNVVTHFPFFDTWEEVWIKKSVVNWNKEGLSIDRFLKQYESKNAIKYRFWEADKKKMTYLSIEFPKDYSKDNKIYLNNILSEKDGVKFSFILMKQIIDTQVEK